MIFSTMNQMKFIFSATLMLLFSLTAFGQRGTYQKSPEEWATEQTQLMEENLVLSSPQKENIYAAHLDFAIKSKSIRDDETMDRAILRDTMEALRLENDELLQSYLTESQWTKWLEVKSELLKQRFRQNKVKETSKG